MANSSSTSQWSVGPWKLLALLKQSLVASQALMSKCLNLHMLGKHPTSASIYLRAILSLPLEAVVPGPSQQQSLWLRDLFVTFAIVEATLAPQSRCSLQWRPPVSSLFLCKEEKMKNLKIQKISGEI